MDSGVISRISIVPGRHTVSAISRVLRDVGCNRAALRLAANLDVTISTVSRDGTACDREDLPVTGGETSVDHDFPQRVDFIGLDQDIWVIRDFDEEAWAFMDRAAPGNGVVSISNVAVLAVTMPLSSELTERGAVHTLASNSASNASTIHDQVRASTAHEALRRKALVTPAHLVIPR